MTQVEQIKAEIERRRRDVEQRRPSRNWGKSYYVMMSELLDIIANLPQEQPSEDLEKEIEEYTNSCEGALEGQQGQVWEFDWEDITVVIDEAAHYFAQWQKAQDERLIKLAHDSWYKEGFIYGKIEGLSEDEKYQQGRFDMREQMMKDAVIAETNVIYDTRKDVYRYQLTLPENTENPYRDCRDWKIIIVKED